MKRDGSDSKEKEQSQENREILFYSPPGLHAKSVSMRTAVECNQKGDKTVALVLYLMLNEIKSFKLDC